MKRFVSVLLALIMLFSLAINSFALATEAVVGMVASAAISAFVNDVYSSGGVINYLSDLLSGSNPEGTLGDLETFMGLSIPAYGSDFTIVSKLYPEDSDYLPSGIYSIQIPRNTLDFKSYNLTAETLILEDSGWWHFTDFYPAAVYDAVSMYLDGTVVTYVCYYRGSIEAYDVFVFDFASYAAYTKIISLLSGIAENMGVVEGGSGGSIDTSEMEDSLSSIDSSLSQVLTYLSALNQNVIDTEKYSKEISEALGDVEVKVANIDADLDGIQDTLDELSLILLNIGADNAEIKGYVDDIEFYIAVIGDRISYLHDYLIQINANIISTNSILSNIKDKIDSVHLSLIDKLNELISAVKGIGSVSGGNSTGSGGGSFVADLLGGIFGVAFEALKLLLNLVFNLLSSVFGLISRFSEFISAFWGDFIPADILAVLFIIPPLSFILGVVKFVRG